MDTDLPEIKTYEITHPWLATKRLKIGGLTCLAPDCLPWKAQGKCSDDCPFSR